MSLRGRFSHDKERSNEDGHCGEVDRLWGLFGDSCCLRIRRALEVSSGRTLTIIGMREPGPISHASYISASDHPQEARGQDRAYVRSPEARSVELAARRQGESVGPILNPGLQSFELSARRIRGEPIDSGATVRMPGQGLGRVRSGG